MNFADGYALVIRTAIEAARPDPELRVDEWAEEFMVLPKSGPQPGPFRFDRSPPARRVHQVLSPGHPCKRVVAKVASQMFKTQTALNWIASIIHRKPRNILALEPTDTLVKRFSARVATMIRNVPELRERVSATKSRDSRNTVQAKDFLGDATLYMNTAGSAANLAEVSAPYIYVDEIDRLERNVDEEGDPVELAEARATQFANDCKFFYTSSPAIKGFSKIDELFAMGTQEVYHVPCPHCSHLHELVLENFHYQRDPDTGFMDRAWFVCPDCGCEIDEHHKTTMLPDVDAGGQARWVATSSGDGETISFTLSAFYMPIGAITWLSLARQHARATDRKKRGDHDSMQVFYNTRLGLSYENADTTTTAKQLRDRTEPYPPRVVPDGALVVTMAVDTQANRLEAQIEAWGPGLEHWVIDYETIIGSPAVPPETPGSVWARLDEIRRTPLLHASGRPIMISAYGIDAGGANTQDVYNYGAARKALGCVVLHGANRPNRPIIGSAPSRVDIEWGGTKTPGGIELWQVGTEVAKDHLANRMHLVDGPGAMHFHDKLQPEWFDQMVVERPRTTWVKGRAVTVWLKPNGARNEAWDCFDEQTDVLTERGWIRFADATESDLFATVDLCTDAIEYQRPQALIRKHYQGNLLCVEGDRLNFAVTPGHRMVTYRKRYDRTLRKWVFTDPPKITLASDLTIHHTIKIAATWAPTGADTPIVVPASYQNSGGQKRAHIEIEPQREIEPRALAALLGWYVSEGHANAVAAGVSTSRRVAIYQNKLAGRAEIERVLCALPWAWRADDRGFYITSKQLYDYIQRECPGLQHERRVPNWIRFASREVIAAFVDAAVAGDGWTMGGISAYRAYATVSPALADDMAELFFKLGGSPRIATKPARRGMIRGRECDMREQYIVRENNRRRSAALDGADRKFMVKPVEYDGMVYCATVPNGTLVVRRNGRMMIAGNCSVYNLALAHQLGLHKWSALDWGKLRAKLVPPTRDLFAPEPAATPAQTTPPPIFEAASPAAVQAAAAVPPPVPAPAPVHTPAPSPVPKMAPYVPLQPATVRRIYSRGIA